MNPIDLKFYQKDDVVFLAKKLLGKYLFTKIDNIITAGIIVETESYNGIEDKASHAYMGRRTKRTEVMFQDGGIVYVYICYGMHALLNVVTNKKDIPHAILIRAIEPKIGIETMLKRRNKSCLDNSLTSGPALLTKAFGITKDFNYLPFNSEKIWIEDKNIKISDKDILASKRVGIDYAEEDQHLPYRFRIRNNPWTSKAS
ncbi:MAG: DNA-3-methyladenine glycosylase [Parachlamydiales bacterium]|nr:DNA-3-methyladenine glycosylase [Parachlamydiales bacterium]